MRRLKLTTSPYYHLLEEDDNFRRWVESLERGSIMTAAVYFRRVGYICTDLKVEPKDVASVDIK